MFKNCKVEKSLQHKIVLRLFVLLDIVISEPNTERTVSQLNAEVKYFYNSLDLME